MWTGAQNLANMGQNDKGSQMMTDYPMPELPELQFPEEEDAPPVAQTELPTLPETIAQADPPPALNFGDTSTPHKFL